jgi:phage gp29-like protein
VDRIAESAVKPTKEAMVPSLTAMLSLIEGVEDGPGWEEKLKRAVEKQFGKADPTELETVLHQAMMMAELAGMAGVELDTRGPA